MTLESLLKPVKWLDEEILAMYTQVSRNWSDRTVCTLAGAFWGASFVSGLVEAAALYSIFPGSPIMVGAVAGEAMALRVPDSLLNQRGLEGRLSNTRTSDVATLPNEMYIDAATPEFPTTEGLRKYVRNARLPVILAGASCLIKCIYDVANYLLTGEFANSQETLLFASLACTYLSLASSMYLKGRDPKLLEREPFYKRAYSWAKEKVKASLPKHIPHPVPVTVDNTYALEGHL